MTRSTFRVLFYANGSKEKNGIVPIMGRVEKPRDFDPFGQAGLSPLATI